MNKKPLLRSGIVFLFLCASFMAHAQKKLTQGKALFDITYPESELDQQTLAMMPTESTIYFKGHMSRSEVKMPMGTTVSITDGSSGETTTLMDMMGNKIAMKVTKDDLEKQRKKTGKEKPEIKITDETKMIAGYSCKKAEVKLKGKDGNETHFDAWFTKDISAPNSMRSGGMTFEGIDGFMMEFQTKMNSLTMKMTCRSVEDAVVPDSSFVVPSGYTMTTMEDMKKNFGGGH
jgi:GLPGLI family protein